MARYPITAIVITGDADAASSNLGGFYMQLLKHLIFLLYLLDMFMMAILPFP